MGYDLCDHGSLRRACEICQRDYEIEALKEERDRMRSEPARYQKMLIDAHVEMEGLRARLDQIKASNERAAKERDMYIEARGRWEKEKALWIEVVEKADAWLTAEDQIMTYPPQFRGQVLAAQAEADKAREAYREARKTLTVR